jgi:hypothetical protein
MATSVFLEGGTDVNSPLKAVLLSEQAINRADDNSNSLPEILILFIGSPPWIMPPNNQLQSS